MILDSFVSTYTNQAVDIDGVLQDTGQCLQLVSLYCQQVLDVPVFFTPAAKDWWEKFNGSPLQPNFTQIPFAGAAPNKGDIVVWGASSLINSPELGHIDIALAANVGGFTGFDSNWGNVNNSEGYPIAHQVNHNFTDILGYLRIKENNMEPLPNDGDIVNAKRASTGVPAYQPTGAELDYYKQLEHGWHDLLYDTIAGMQVQIDQAKQLVVNHDTVVKYVQDNLS